MADCIHIGFAEHITSEDWEKFCKTNGIVYCPHITGELTYAASLDLEIELELSGWDEPKPVIKGVKLIVASQPAVVQAVRLTRKLADSFNGFVLKYDEAFISFFREQDGFSVWDEDEDATHPSVEETMEHVRSHLRRVLSDTIGQRCDSTAPKRIKIAMETAMRKMSVQCSTVEAREAHHTWKSLYPKRWARAKAWFAHRILGASTEFYTEPTAFEKWLGYKHEREIVCDPDDVRYFDEAYPEYSFYEKVEQAMSSGHMYIRDVCRLPRPHTTIETDITFVPTKPAQRIAISFKVNPGEWDDV